MELTYVGGHDAVQVRVPEWHVDPTVAHGDSFDFPDAVAAGLLEQPANWQRTQPVIPLEDRIAAVRNHDDANELAPELGLQMEGTTPKLDDKKAALAAALEERNAAEAEHDNDDGLDGQEQ